VRQRDLRVLIAGGGIGGITTALALRQRGIDAVLFEQAEAFREVGAGIQLSANATRVLRTLGLGEALSRTAVYPEGRDLNKSAFIVTMRKRSYAHSDPSAGEYSLTHRRAARAAHPSLPAAAAPASPGPAPDLPSPRGSPRRCRAPAARGAGSG
jgi:2-polyprenyl-6-methoxyphenol hydroxylase-like FAD-dependent oxidoreductase